MRSRHKYRQGDRVLTPLGSGTFVGWSPDPRVYVPPDDRPRPEALVRIDGMTANTYVRPELLEPIEEGSSP